MDRFTYLEQRSPNMEELVAKNPQSCQFGISLALNRMKEAKLPLCRRTAAAKDSNTTNSHEHLSVRRPAEYARLSPAFHQQAQEKLFTSRISKVLLLKRLNMKRTAPGGHSARLISVKGSDVVSYRGKGAIRPGAENFCRAAHASRTEIFNHIMQHY